MEQKAQMKNILRMHAVSSGFAGALIGIFIPIYLLGLGKPLAEVMLFLIVHNIVLFGAALCAVRFLQMLDEPCEFVVLGLCPPIEFCHSRFDVDAVETVQLISDPCGRIRRCYLGQKLK